MKDWHTKERKKWRMFWEYHNSYILALYQEERIPTMNYTKEEKKTYKRCFWLHYNQRFEYNNLNEIKKTHKTLC